MGVENFSCMGTVRVQPSASCVLEPRNENPRQGERRSFDRRSFDRQREARIDTLPSDLSATVSFDALEMDRYSKDKADSKPCSPKKFLSSSDGDGHSKLFRSRKISS
uniref:Uncharacterized protein n=1 Tax=Nothobranchius pienaari TaxID=704102 RepID=A0A1A8QRG9_9TELE